MPETNEDGLRVRTREDGVEVLDGAQRCAAFVHVHQMEREEEVVEFADGTPLVDVEDTMATLTETLLSNCSEVGFGWYVPDESKQTKTTLKLCEHPEEHQTLSDSARMGRSVSLPRRGCLVCNEWLDPVRVI